MKYHKKFKNFHRRTITITEQFFQARPFRGPLPDRIAKFEEWLQQASEIYSIPCPRLVVEADEDAARAIMERHVEQHGADGAVILLPIPSVVLLFHSFRHHMQCHGIGPRLGAIAEADAHGWACSLYFTVRPSMFRSAVQKGLVHGVHPIDLEADTVHLSQVEQHSFEELANQFMEDVPEELAALLAEIEGDD